VSELIKKGAKIDVVSSSGSTPLFSACQAGFTRTVTVLVDAGASVEATDESGINPLMIAAMRSESSRVLDSVGWKCVNTIYISVMTEFDLHSGYLYNIVCSHVTGESIT
jgi:hypothetical protein